MLRGWILVARGCLGVGIDYVVTTTTRATAPPPSNRSVFLTFGCLRPAFAVWCRATLLPCFCPAVPARVLPCVLAFPYLTAPPPALPSALSFSPPTLLLPFQFTSCLLVGTSSHETPHYRLSHSIVVTNL